MTHFYTVQKTFIHILEPEDLEFPKRPRSRSLPTRVRDNWSFDVAESIYSDDFTDSSRDEDICEEATDGYSTDATIEKDKSFRVTCGINGKYTDTQDLELDTHWDDMLAQNPYKAHEKNTWLDLAPPMKEVPEVSTGCTAADGATKIMMYDIPFQVTFDQVTDTLTE